MWGKKKRYSGEFLSNLCQGLDLIQNLMDRCEGKVLYTVNPVIYAVILFMRIM